MKYSFVSKLYVIVLGEIERAAQPKIAIYNYLTWLWSHCSKKPSFASSLVKFDGNDNSAIFWHRQSITLENDGRSRQKAWNKCTIHTASWVVVCLFFLFIVYTFAKIKLFAAEWIGNKKILLICYKLFCPSMHLLMQEYIVPCENKPFRGVSLDGS